MGTHGSPETNWGNILEEGTAGAGILGQNMLDRGAYIHNLWVAGGGGLVAKLCLSLASQWAVAHQASLSMIFSRQEYWSGCHFLLQEIFLTLE